MLCTTIPSCTVVPFCCPSGDTGIVSATGQVNGEDRGVKLEVFQGQVCTRLPWGVRRNFVDTREDPGGLGELLGLAHGESPRKSRLIHEEQPMQQGQGPWVQE